MPSNLTSVEPVRKAVTVPAAPQRAFELFTAHIQEWWPLETHSVGGEHAAGVVFGEGVGAAIVETLADGSTSVWGTVTALGAAAPRRLHLACRSSPRRTRPASR